MNGVPLFNCIVFAALVWSFCVLTAWSQTSLPAPTPGEARIRKALDETTEFEFKELPFANVLAHIRLRHHIQVQADEEALRDAGVGNDAPITLSVRDITLRSALRLLLRDLDLTYFLRDGYLLITNKTEAENLVAPRIYLVGDLLTIDGKPAARSASDYQTLQTVIMTTVAPTTWDEGRQGFSSFHPGRALIIPQTDEVHEEIEEVLTALRAARDKQFKLAEQPQVPEPENENDGAVTTRIYRLNVPAMWRGSMGLGGFGVNGRSGILAQMGGGMGGPAMGGMGMGGLGLPADAKQLEAWTTELADLLPQIVEPKSWEANGGGGVVHRFAGALIVKQTGAVHREVAKLLSELVLGTQLPPRSGPAKVSPVAPRAALRNWPCEPEPRPGKREEAIEQALSAKTDVEFKEMPLQKLKEWIQQSHNIQVVFDEKALADAGLDCSVPLTLHLADITLREALRMVLDELELTYLCAYEVLMITSKTEAESMLSTKVYPVLDLATTAAADARSASDSVYQSLAEIIMSNVTSAGWDSVGGPGTVQTCPNCAALIVSQTEAGHAEVQRLLQSLRDARNLAANEN